jgi:hypothetical protein
MVVGFYLGLAALLVGVYWLIGRDIDRAVKHKNSPRQSGRLGFPEKQAGRE